MSQSTKSSGISLLGLVFLIFLVLKLTGIGAVATWSWWWVTAPLWLPTAAYIGFLGSVIILGILAVILAAIFGNRD
jgi:fatty acid desaturase